MTTQNQSYSLLRMLREGREIDINLGTFGGKGSAFWGALCSRVTLTTGMTSFSLFKDVMNSGAITSFDTNLEATQVPQGERWDLYGLYWFLFSPSGAALTAPQKAAFANFIANASYTINYGNTIAREQPLWENFSSQMAQETAVTPTLALASPVPVAAAWGEMWPEETYLPLSSNVVLNFNVKCAALPSDLNNFKLGAAFPRLKVAQSV